LPPFSVATLKGYQSAFKHRHSEHPIFRSKARKTAAIFARAIINGTMTHGLGDCVKTPANTPNFSLGIFRFSLTRLCYGTSLVSIARAMETGGVSRFLFRLNLKIPKLKFGVFRRTFHTVSCPAGCHNLVYFVDPA